MEPSRDIATLLSIMARLRTPGTGCEWDLRQTFATVAPYTVEEAYEVADAIGRGDVADIRDELGDLLFQVVFHARMAEEAGWFDFGDVVAAISGKMIRRHPHVFGGEERPADAEQAAASWARIKAEEAAGRAADRAGAGRSPDALTPPGVLGGVARALPAITRARKLQAQAAQVGFEWTDPRDVLAKLHEEVTEVEEAVASGDPDAQADEIGDALFALVNLARRLGLDAEAALGGANAKFERRFRHIERALAAEGRSPAGATLAEMEALWGAAKDAERAAIKTGIALRRQNISE